MDDLLAEISNLKSVKQVLSRLHTTTISCYANDMEDNRCSVLEASEAPFFMSQLLSKLNPRDNSNFGREMLRQGKKKVLTTL